MTLKSITGRGAESYDVRRLSSQEGKTIIVTGGHSGIGYATTRLLLQAGCKVIIAARTPSKADEAKKQLVQENADWESRLGYVKLDLNSLKQTAEAAKELRNREKRLDGIINNAGIMATRYRLTDDGIEEQFQVNHLSHWLFTMRLLPLLEETARQTGHPSRVVNLSSWAHNFITWFPLASPSFESLDKVNRHFPDPTGFIRYSQAKLSAILFSRELNKRLSENVRAISVHPGFVNSDLYKSAFYLRPLTATFVSLEQGAWSSVYAALDPEVEEKALFGSYLVPFCKPQKTTAAGEDPELAKQLWDFCEKLVAEKLQGDRLGSS